MHTIQALYAEPLKSFAVRISLCCAAAILPASALAQRSSVSINIGVEIETRGPVHEAFAEPVVFDPDPGLIVPQPPPPLIEEVPPDERPEGEFVSWVPGYWSWDDDRRSYLWVSGIWRSIPPGRQFVPGYWTQTSGGHQWVSGFWLSVDEQDVEYLPQPPAPLSLEPVGAAPAPDYIWVPGCWRWQQGTYVWRPGYWVAPQPNWVWVPAHYVRTPSGYVFVSGYWDYVVPRRGLLFAPAYIERTVITRPGFVYRPTVVINSQVLVENLFARPGYRHYYFGDYYAPTYRQAGILPIHVFHSSPQGYSALYAHTVAVHRRTDPVWERRFIRTYELRRDRVDARPPRTWVSLERMRRDRVILQDPVRSQTVVLARPLTELANERSAREIPLRIQKTSPEQRESVRQQLTRLREYQAQRRQLELSSADKSPLRISREQIRPGEGARAPAAQARPGARPTPQAQPRGQDPRDAGRQVEPSEGLRSLRLRLPRSPLSAQARESDRSKATPQRPDAPKANPSVRPRERSQGPERDNNRKDATPSGARKRS